MMPYIELSDKFSLPHKTPTGMHSKINAPSRIRSENKFFMRNALNVFFTIFRPENYRKGIFFTI